MEGGAAHAQATGEPATYWNAETMAAIRGIAAPTDMQITSALRRFVSDEPLPFYTGESAKFETVFPAYWHDEQYTKIRTIVASCDDQRLRSHFNDYRLAEMDKARQMRPGFRFNVDQLTNATHEATYDPCCNFDRVKKAEDDKTKAYYENTWQPAAHRSPGGDNA